MSFLCRLPVCCCRKTVSKQSRKLPILYAIYSNTVDILNTTFKQHTHRKP
jgi:hypothetical protein